MTVAMRQLDISELDLISGGNGGFWAVVKTAFVATVCKVSAEAIVGGLATGLETAGAGFVIAAAGGVAGAACGYFEFNGGN